jgi:putative ABC transport system substrate-binding protein
MKRREFITLVGGAVAWPLAADAQQKGKLPVIGVLNPGSTDTPGAVGFYDGMRELGYTEGLNIAIERRYGDWNTDRFQQLAADLVQLRADVIVVISIARSRSQTSNQHNPSRSWAAWPIQLVMN